MSQLPLAVRLPDHADFENFVAGDNAAAVAAVRRLARKQQDPVLWLWGGASTGKTHLLQASCAAAARDGFSAAYLPLAQWKEAGPEVLAGWDEHRLLCIDDVDAVAGLPEWEAALFALFNATVDRRASMLCVAGAAPAACGFTLPDLASRLASGAVFRLGALREGERLHALKLRFGRRGLELPPATAQWLARHYRRDLHSLFALLEKLDLESLVAQRRLTVPFVRSVLFSGGAPNGDNQGAEQRK